MSAARDYRRLVLRMGEASLAREQRKAHSRELLFAFILSSLVALALVVFLAAFFSGMVGRSVPS
jgi:hypothetical protein